MSQSATKRVYLAGPMTGYASFNFPAFHRYAGELRAKGFKVFSPAENDYLLYGDDFLEHPERASYRLCMEDDLRWIARYADAIALMPGWEKSRGAKVELALAELLHLEVITLAA